MKLYQKIGIGILTGIAIFASLGCSREESYPSAQSRLEMEARLKTNLEEMQSLPRDEVEKIFLYGYERVKQMEKTLYK